MLIFDAETNGLLEEVTEMHCLVIYDTDTDTLYTYDPQSKPIEQGIRKLAGADLICGHNVIGYDIPVIKKLYPEIWAEFKGKVRDTLVMARVTYPDIGSGDFARYRGGLLPAKLIGSYSLEAWGYRMGHFKGDYGKQDNAWETWDEEMTKYCQQDVRVTYELWTRMEKKNVSPECLELEHRVAEIIQGQVENGFLIDQNKMKELSGLLAAKRAELAQELTPLIPPIIMKNGSVFTPKRDNPLKGYVAGAPMTKIKYVNFNPGSRNHVAKALKILHGWEPQEFTDNGQPKVDDETLNKLPYPEAKKIAEYMMVTKRLGQIIDGAQAWANYINKRTGRIHGGVNTNGAVTGRMTHMNPNLAQVPAGYSPYGHECRSCFIVPPGYKLVGCDADGLEARCLAHFMARYDNGAFIDVILNGSKKDGTDVHSMNAKALGMSRDDAKTWFYAFMYGAGDELLGDGSKALGAKRRKKFMKALPALAKLVKAVQDRVKQTKCLRGLDGRILPIRSQHAALNTLLQSAGALIMKQALIFTFDRLTEEGIDFKFVCNIHDEFQMEIREDQAERAGQIAKQAIQDAGKHFNFRCPLDGSYDIGNNWSETH